MKYYIGSDINYHKKISILLAACEVIFKSQAKFQIHMLMQISNIT